MSITAPKSFGLTGILALAYAGIVLAAASGGQAAKAPQSGGDAKRGEYLVKSGGCGDCHTPMTPGPKGPQPDVAKGLSGHPESLVIPSAPPLPKAPWMAMVSSTFTAWTGPWGVSFSANLTPDKETGIGGFGADTFVKTILSGRVAGTGRAILPPMPIPALQNLTDGDLRAMFAYLASQPPVRNKVPAPLPPAAGMKTPATAPSKK